MQIFLNQAEIEVAIENYIEERGISLDHNVVSVSFTAGRKENGLVAEVQISPISDMIMSVTIDDEEASPEVLPEATAPDAVIDGKFDAPAPKSLFG